jgi:hypothetical protein
VTRCRRLRRPRPLLLPCFLIAAAVLAAPACGKKGPPLAPLQIVPARVEEPKVRRLGGDVYLQFTIPTRNTDGSSPADVASIEVYAVDGPLVDQAGRPLDAPGFARAGVLVGKVDVEPAQPAAGLAGDPAARREEPLPRQGEAVTVVDRSPEVAPPPPAAEAQEEPKPIVAPLMPRPAPVPVRTYGIVPASTRHRAGQMARVSVEFRELPARPARPDVTYTETAVLLEWPPAAAAGARAPIQAPATGDLLPARPLFGDGAAPHAYNVYARAPVTAPAKGEPTMPTPLNPAPLAAPQYEEARVEFGVERCFVVRAVETHGTVTIESEPSEPACVTPRDTFPPAAPRHLAAVGSEGAINLIWEPNEEADLAGYLVLRGEADADQLRAITPEAIQETTFRDTAVQPGARYVYAIVAIDTASPPNRSAESNRVEETAR